MTTPRATLPTPPPTPVIPSRLSKRHAISSFSQVFSAGDNLNRDIARYQETRRTELWESIEEPTPPATGFIVIMSFKKFNFGPSMQYAEMYHGLVRYLIVQTNRKPVKPIVLLSKTYQEAIYDAKSYESWVVWMKGRSPEDRILLAV